MQPATPIRGLRIMRITCAVSNPGYVVFIDLQVGSDTIFFGLGNLGLMIVGMSYDMSLCFGSTQPEPATEERLREQTRVVR